MAPSTWQAKLEEELKRRWACVGRSDKVIGIVVVALVAAGAGYTYWDQYQVDKANGRAAYLFEMRGYHYDMPNATDAELLEAGEHACDLLDKADGNIFEIDEASPTLHPRTWDEASGTLGGWEVAMDFILVASSTLCPEWE
jgi:hypothetical protein